MFIHDRLGRRKDATGAIVDFIRVASSSGMGSTHLIGHELGHNLMSIARDAGVITEAQQKELDALFTDKNGKFDEEAFAEAFARELKRAFFETVQKRMEDVPPTKAGRTLRRVADFIATLARSFAFWRQERGLDPVTGQPLQAGQVLDAFLKRERTAVDEATQVTNAARAAEARATQEAMANAPTQTVVDEDGTEVAYHERGQVSAEEDSAYLDAVRNGDLDTARRMVVEAARQAGYDVEAFHGTGRFGFTVFNPRRLKNGDLRPEDERTIFLGNLALASSYSGEVEPRELGKPVPKISLAKMMKDDASFLKEVRRIAKLVGADVKIKKWYERDFHDYSEIDFKEDIESEIQYAIIEKAWADSSPLQFWIKTPSLARGDLRYDGKRTEEDFKAYMEGQKADFTKWLNGFNGGTGTYALGVRMENPLIIDAEGAQWLWLPLPEGGRGNTHALAKWALEHGYDGVVINNVRDQGEYNGSGPYNSPQTEYIVFDSEQVKSLDVVTYDDNRKIIPLSERFNPENLDIRWHTPDEAGRGDRDVTAEDFVRTFGIRLVMDGNARSQDTANICYDTLLKLAKLMGVPQETLGIGGLLTLDVSVVEEMLNPMFNPANNTINLPIPHNVGIPEIATAATIVHEWTHALDRIVGLGRDADPNVEITEETSGALSHGEGAQVRKELLQAGNRMTEALRNTRFYERISNDEEIKAYDREDLRLQLFDPQEVFARALENYYMANERGRLNMDETLFGPTMEELDEVGPILREFFSVLKVGVNETTGVDTLYHVKVWSGARQAYDRVDLAYVGTGTGGNNEGRGAYSSGVRGVAQGRYARYKVEEWKRAQEGGDIDPEDIPIVYDGKPMRLGDAFVIAERKIADSRRAGISPSEEDLAVKRMLSDAHNYWFDNGFIYYSEFRRYLFAVYVNRMLGRRLGKLLQEIEEAERVMAEPTQKRMMYRRKDSNNPLTAWSPTKSSDSEEGEMRDVYAVNVFGTMKYIDAEALQKQYESMKAQLESPELKEELGRYEKVRALYESIIPEKMSIPPENSDLPLPAVMEQTWFTNRPEGDVSHLLSWLDPVTPEQMDWIVEAAEKAGFTENEIAFLWGRHKKGVSTPQGRGVYMRLETIFHSRANKKPLESYTGDEIQTIHDEMVFEYGKLASEFLLTADIDGVRYPVNYRKGSKHGEEGWNYVAFSDEHLRVDHVYEYNPETDGFELKWHESEGGASLRFTETPLGQELVAKAFDAIVGSRVDLLLRPSRYYGNPYETAKRNPRDRQVVEKLGREIDVSEPRGFAAEVSAEISRFGTREGDPTLREIRARCGSKARFYEVLGAVYETAEAVRSGLSEVVTGRERAMMENAGLQAADFIKHNATARATALGRKLYLMGREFAWKLYKEDIAAARAEAQAKVQEANAKTREAKAQTRNAERREETARNQAYQNRWGLAEERFMREYERALLRHQAARKVSDVREKMQEQVDLLRLREAKKRALERERGVTFTALKATLGVDIPARLRALAGTQEDPFEAAAKLIVEIDAGFDKWVKRDRRDLLDGTEPYTYLNEQGERAYAETMGNVLKAVARDLSYGKLREALVNAADKIAREKHETVRVIVEGKLGRVARVLRLAQNADIVTLANRRIKSALAEANKRLSSANSGMRTRYMTAMRKQAKELIKTMQLAVSAQDNTKASEKKRYAILAERARLAEELKVIESGKTPDDLAKDETLTDRQHQDAVKLMFLEKFGDLSYTIDPAEVWAKAAEAEGFVVS